MKIRDRVLLSTTFSVVVVGTICLALFFALKQVEKEKARDDALQATGNSIVALQAITFQYLLHHEARMHAQWEDQYAALTRNIQGITAKNADEAALFARIVRNHENVRAIFAELEVLLHGGDGGGHEHLPAGEAVAGEAKALFGGQILLKTEEMLSRTGQLAAASEKETRKGREKVLLGSIVFFVLLLAQVLLNAFLMLRSIVGPISKLQAGTECIAAGNLEYQTNIRSHDEIGSLSAAFDVMTESLRKTLVSRDELAREVEARRVAEAELQRSNTELEQFAFIASHDLQEPLRKIIAFGDRLVMHAGADFDEEGRDSLQRIQTAAGRMKQLIEDLLDYSRVTAQARPFEAVSLAEVVEETMGTLEHLLIETGGRIETSGRLPEVEGDRDQFRQLLQNLLANGLKYHKPEVPPRITVSAEAKGDRLEIIIEDNGIGFDEKYLDRIFLPFQRLHSRDVYEGTGIGLAICDKIVRRHGGAITAKSRPGAGSRFIVTLPRVQRQAASINKEIRRP